MSFLYPHNIESKIGFDTVRAFIRERCQSPLGILHVDLMRYMTDVKEISNHLNQTFEMKKIYESGGNMPEVSFNELHRWLPELKTVNSYAPSENYIQLKNTLNSFNNVKSFFIKRKGETEDTELLYPSLGKLFGDITVFPNIINEINSIFDKNGNIKDSASIELAEVRHKLAGMQGSISRTIQKIFAGAVKEGIVDKDSAPTIRDGRMVIPVYANNKRSIKGIIHDESATGKTVFIEPAETVELSNRLRELQLEEQRIIVKILIQLSDFIRPSIDDILQCNKRLGILDFICAKAKFALEIGGEMPTINKKPEIDWYGAVHPVLFYNLKRKGEKVIPLDIRLEGKKRILVISGPNAGGKSVALKTVGMVQYMFQCGILPSLYSNSHMGLFNKIFIDIGDEQSIENDLSTYSSHLKNMRQFLLHADGKSLILIDEIGSGTEPNIGAALAKSILVKLAETRCFGIITTHYHNLKSFAEEAENFINGAMLYDRQRLQPTFKLSIGNAGSSFALEIATKIGLPKNIIENAKREVGEEYVESDKFLMEIARDRKYWQSKRDNIKERENKISKLEARYETLIEELNHKRKEIIREAQEEAKLLLANTNKKIENTIQEIRKTEAEKERTKQIRKELEEYKKEVSDTSFGEIKSLPKIKEKKAGKNANKNSLTKTKAVSVNKEQIEKELQSGDYVKMTGSNVIGQIISVEGKEAEVAFGNIRSKVKLSRLQKAGKPTSSNINKNYVLINGTSNEYRRQKQLNFKDELDIRGKRADEALNEVVHFIDDAIQLGVRKVRILHGTGSGILRQLVRQQLGATKGILKFEDEDVRMGGAGITVVSLV